MCLYHIPRDNKKKVIFDVILYEPFVKYNGNKHYSLPKLSSACLPHAEESLVITMLSVVRHEVTAMFLKPGEVYDTFPIRRDDIFCMGSSVQKNWSRMLFQQYFQMWTHKYEFGKDNILFYSVLLLWPERYNLIGMNLVHQKGLFSTNLFQKEFESLESLICFKI